MPSIESLGAPSESNRADLLARLARVSTTSLVDAAPTLRILPLCIRPVRPGCRAVGPVVTATANRDLMSVIAALRDAPPGSVLVVDAGGDERAVAGELFGTEAQRRGLAGLIIHGRCRDGATLTTLSIPVWATGFAPNAYPARALPQTAIPLDLAGVRVEPGDLLAGDDDGILVGSANEMAAALAGAEAIEEREKRLQAAMLAGASLFDAMNYDEHLAALQAGEPGGLAIG